MGEVEVKVAVLWLVVWVAAASVAVVVLVAVLWLVVVLVVVLSVVAVVEALQGGVCVVLAVSESVVLYQLLLSAELSVALWLVGVALWHRGRVPGVHLDRHPVVQAKNWPPSLRLPPASLAPRHCHRHHPHHLYWVQTVYLRLLMRGFRPLTSSPLWIRSDMSLIHGHPSSRLPRIHSLHRLRQGHTLRRIRRRDEVLLHKERD